MKLTIIALFITWSFISHAENSSPDTYTLPPNLQGFCYELSKKFEEYKWGHPQCENFKWSTVRKSKLGTPLIWSTFGEEKTPAAENTTLILCGVHGDEITPVKFCWDLMNELRKNHTFSDKLVVVAPLVTPDSFFIKKPTRTNASGVDVNRNFPTTDWNADAHKKWKETYKKDKRKFPGQKA